MPLAHPHQRRQDVQPSSSSESPSPSSSPFLPITYFNNNVKNNNSSLYNKFASSSSSSQPPPALDLNYSFSSNDCYYIDSRQSTPSDRYNFALGDTQYMQNSPSQYPQLRVRQSASNGLPSATTPPPMVEDFSQQSWNSAFPDNAYLAPSPQHSYNPSLSYRTHKRLPSDSSVASLGPDSPYTQSTTYPQIVDSDVQSIHSAHLENWEYSSSNNGQYPKPAFGQASNSDLFYNPAFQNFNSVSNDALSMTSAQTAMGQAINQQHGSNTNGVHKPPRRTFNRAADSSSDIRSNTPQLDRTMSDVYQDELYNPALAQSGPSSRPRQQHVQGNTVSPHRSAFSDLLQVANTGHLTARSASPAINVSRQRSPFCESSQFAVEGGFSNPSSPAGATRLTSAAQLRQQQKQEADAHAYAQHHPPSQQYLNPPNTISPKEALLDHDNSEEDAKMPLFPTLKQEPQFPSQNSTRGLHRGNTDESNNNDQGYPPIATSTRDSSSSSAIHPSGPGFSLMPPSAMPPSVPAIPQQYPFISQSRRQSSSMRSGSDHVPEFPASLTSMESTKSENGLPEKVKIIPEADQSHRSPPSSQETPVSRPANTTASSGTYTCTTPNCHARFDAAGKLQKHRREAHGPASQYASTPTTPTSATPNPQAAANNVSRNNAPGPHRCDKVNPQTGKPCNTVFSRSYDLTRHEDTIHNNRKSKVHCQLCTEEKTFSRNDALTRHMRVVHPDVDFPGKSRRGRNEGVDVVRQRIETGRGGR